MAGARRPDYDLLGIYLNDHLGGATGGLELFRRAARAQRGTAAGPELQRLAAEIQQDKAALLGMMQALGVPIRQYKVALGWGAEKVGRLKFNGRLRSRSPLTSVVESEAMRIGVEGKAAGWRVLRVLADHDGRLDPDVLDDLIARAEAQARAIEKLHLEAAAAVF